VRRDGAPLVYVCCPACGVWGDLGEHEIADDGRVTPSVICGNDGEVRTVRIESRKVVVEHQGDRTTPCTFHDFIQLDGWPSGN
jgi:hypothetical protein